MPIDLPTPTPDRLHQEPSKLHIDQANDLFYSFMHATTCSETLKLFSEVKSKLNITEPGYANLLPLRKFITKWQAKKFLHIFTIHANQKDYYSLQPDRIVYEDVNKHYFPSPSSNSSTTFNLTTGPSHAKKSKTENHDSQSRHSAPYSSSNSKNIPDSSNQFAHSSIQKKSSSSTALPSHATNRACSECNALIVGAGPVGLRTAIELSLLGCNTVVVELREEFTRLNLVHIWKSAVADLKSLGIKKIFGQFCNGELNHIAISKLQLCLLKLSLIAGVEVFTGTRYQTTRHPASQQKPWKPTTLPELPNSCPVKHRMDVLIGADGKETMIPGFDMKTLRGKLAIGLTVNLKNSQTENEKSVEEIPGIGYQYKRPWFDKLKKIYNIGLENIVYYKNEHHYFVMTPKKESLLARGVFKQDHGDVSELLSWKNIDKDRLEQYARDTVNYATNDKLKGCEFMINSRGESDCGLFDFTSMWQAKHASITRQVNKYGRPLLTQLIGDSLLNPFWPMGTGIGRGFQSGFDAAWLVKQFEIVKSETLNESGISDFRINAQVEIAKRELVYNHIFTSLDKEYKNLIEPWSRHTIDPQTRYPEYKNVVLKAGAAGSKIGKQNWYMADEAKKSLSRPSISRSILVENGDYGVNGADGSHGLNGYNGSNFSGSNGLNGIMSPIRTSSALKALNSSPYPQNSPRKKEVQQALDSYSSERIKKNSKRRSNERTKKLIQSSPKSMAMIDKLIHSLNNMIGESTEYGFKVEDCGTSWRSGKMLAALLHSHNSELFDYHRTIARLNSTPKLIQEMIDICKNVFNVKFVEKYEDLMLVGTDEGVTELDLAYSLQMLLTEFRHKKKERRNRDKMITSSANGQLLDSDLYKNAVSVPRPRNIENMNSRMNRNRLDVTDSTFKSNVNTESDLNQVSGTDISGNAPTSPKSSPLHERTTPVLTGGKPILNRRVSPRKTRRSMTMTITNSYDKNYSTPETTEIKYENNCFTPKNAPKKLMVNESRLNNSNLDNKVVEKLISEKVSEVSEFIQLKDPILEKSKSRRATRKISTDQTKSENSKLGNTTEDKNINPPSTPNTKIDVQSTFTPETNPLDNSFTDRTAQLTSWRKKYRQNSKNALRQNSEPPTRQKSEPPARQNSEPPKKSPPEVQKLTPTKPVRRSVTAEFNKLDNVLDKTELKLPNFKTPFKVPYLKEPETPKFRNRSGTLNSEFDNSSPAKPEQLMYTPMKSLENFKTLTPQSPKDFRTPEYRRENATHSIQSPSFTDLPGTPKVSKLKSTKNQAKESISGTPFRENNSSIPFAGLETVSPQPNTIEKIENDSPNFKIRRRRTKKLSESDPQYRSSSESLSKNFSGHNSRNNSPKPELQSKGSKRSSLASPNTSENVLMNDLNKYRNDSANTYEPYQSSKNDSVNRNDTVDLTTISLLDEDFSYSTLRTSSTIVNGLDKVSSLEQINVFDQINQNLIRKGQKSNNSTLEIKKVSPMNMTPISSDLNSAFHFPECKTPNNLDSDVDPATEEFYTPQLTSTTNLHTTNLQTTNLQTNGLRDSLEKLNDFPVKSRSRIRRARTARANTTSIVYSSKENTPESSMNSTPKLTTPKTPELPKRASLAEPPRRIFVTPEPDSQAPRISKLKKVVAKPSNGFRRSSADNYLDNKTIDKDSTSDQLFYTPMAKTPFKPSLFKTQPPESPLNSAFLGDTTQFGDISTHNYSSITTPSQDLSSFSTPSPTKNSLSREKSISGLKLRPERSAEKRRERREKSRTMNIIYNNRPKNEINFDKENDSSDDVDPALARIRDNTNKLNELTRQAKQLSLEDGEIKFGEIKKVKPVEIKNSRDSKKLRDNKRNEVLARTEKRDKERRFQKSLSIQCELDETKDLLDEIERQNNDFERSSSFDDGGNNAENVNKWIQLLRMRKNFVTKQDRLKNELRELQLQDKQAELHKKLRNMKLDTTIDSSKFEAQRELTEQITEIVYQRDRLVKTIADLRGEEELSQSTLQF